MFTLIELLKAVIKFIYFSNLDSALPMGGLRADHISVFWLLRFQWSSALLRLCQYYCMYLYVSSSAISKYLNFALLINKTTSMLPLSRTHKHICVHLGMGTDHVLLVRSVNQTRAYFEPVCQFKPSWFTNQFGWENTH